MLYLLLAISVIIIGTFAYFIKKKDKCRTPKALLWMNWVSILFAFVGLYSLYLSFEIERDNVDIEWAKQEITWSNTKYLLNESYHPRRYFLATLYSRAEMDSLEADYASWADYVDSMRIHVDSCTNVRCKIDSTFYPLPIFESSMADEPDGFKREYLQRIIRYNKLVDNYERLIDKKEVSASLKSYFVTPLYLIALLISLLLRGIIAYVNYVNSKEK